MQDTSIGDIKVIYTVVKVMIISGYEVIKLKPGEITLQTLECL
jgi:hypothetical protein